MSRFDWFLFGLAFFAFFLAFTIYEVRFSFSSHINDPPPTTLTPTTTPTVFTPWKPNPVEPVPQKSIPQEKSIPQVAKKPTLIQPIASTTATTTLPIETNPVLAPAVVCLTFLDQTTTCE